MVGFPTYMPDFGARFDPLGGGYTGGILGGGQPSGGVLGGGGFSQLLDPQVALPIASALIGGRNLQQSLAGATQVAGQVIPDMRRRAALNAWIKAKSGQGLSAEDSQLLQNYPELAGSIAQNMMTPHRQFQQIGTDILGQPKYGFVDTSTETITPAADAGSSFTGMSGAPGGQGGQGQGGRMGGLYENLPKPQQAIVDAMIDGRQPFPGSFAMKSPYWNTLIAAANEKLQNQGDPTGFDASNWNLRLKTKQDFSSAGKSGQAITAGNTAIGHLDDLDAAVDKMGNFHGWPVVNRTLNQAANLTAEESGNAENLKAFRSIRQKYVDEITKFYLGTGGSLSDREAAIRDLDEAGSPQELHTAIMTQVQLIKSKVDALKQQYGVNMRGAADPQVISQKSQEAIARIAKRYRDWGGNDPDLLGAAGDLEGQGGQPSGGAATAAGAAKSLPPGEYTWTPPR